MNKLKSLNLILTILVIITVFVMIRTSDNDLFKQNPQTAIKDSTDSINSISFNELEMLTTPYEVIDLTSSDYSNSSLFQHSINIPFEQLLDKKSRKKLNKIDGKILIYSDDISVSSRAWVILHQLDYKEVFILLSNKHNEVFNYKFQPDTLSRLEL